MFFSTWIIWDFDLNAKLSMTELYHEYELFKNTTPEFEPFYEKYLHHNKILWARYQNGFISSEELKWKRMWRTLLDFKIGDERLAKEMGSRFLDILPTKTELFPHTIEILDYLKEKNYALHLITNGFEKTQLSKIKHSKIDHFFSEVITSEKSNFVKPNKEIFDYAMLKAKANLKESIMIGDNPDADIQGAINAGMDNIFVNHISSLIDIQPTYTITHLNQLENIL